MTRDEQEMSLWREAYTLAISQGANYGQAAKAATTAAESFRQRYPAEPTAPAPVWYDEPPRPGEYHVVGLPRVCWVDKDIVWFPVWDLAQDRQLIRELPRNGRRVCPITKPQEPLQ